MSPRLFLLFHGRFPSEKAAALFVAESARAYAAHLPVVIVVPWRIGRTGTSYEQYHLPKDVRVVYLPDIDLFHFPLLSRVAFSLSYILFTVGSFFYLLRQLNKEDIVETNEWLSALLATYISRNVVYEVHDYPEHFRILFQKLFDRARFVLVTNKWKKEKLQKQFSMPEQKLILERNGVDIEKFAPLDKSVAREKLGLPKDARIAVYTGHLYGWKGVDTLARAAELVPDVLVCFVGGTSHDIGEFKKKYGGIQNIRMVEHRPHDEVPLWQAAADVLVLPNTGKEEVSSHYTSPMKLFEYMASERPIVASRIPSILEVLPQEAGYFAEADNSDSFAVCIKQVLEDPAAAVSRVAHAYAMVAEYSWKKRAERILLRLNL